MLIVLFSTFLKRKGGLFKKAHELSVLCSVEVAVIIFGHNKKLYEYSSGDINETIDRFHYVRAIHFAHDLETNDSDSMAAHMSIKAQETSMVGAWTMRTMMRWAHRPLRIQCHESTVFLHIYKMQRAS